MLISTLFLTLLLAPVQQSETVFDGTQGDDLVVINVERSTVAINGVISRFPTDGSDVRVRGLGGEDRVVLRADPGVSETANMTSRSITVLSGSDRVVAAGFEVIDFRADEDDRIVMEDSSGDDSILIENDLTTLVCEDCLLTATGVRSLELVGSEGGDDSVEVAVGVAQRLVARPEGITMTSATGRVWQLEGVEDLVSQDIAQFTFFDSPEDDRLIIGRRRLTWVTPDFRISQIGAYETIVASSDRFERSGFDQVLMRMQEQDETVARFARRPVPDRDTTLIFSDVEKRVTLTNFEDIEVDMLPGPSSQTSSMTFGTVEQSNLSRVFVDPERKRADFGQPFRGDVRTSGFDVVTSINHPLTWTGTSGTDELVYEAGLTSSVARMTFLSEDFEFHHEGPRLDIIADAGEGHDTATFFHGGTADLRIRANQDELLMQESVFNPFSGINFEETRSVVVGDNLSPRLSIEANRTVGPVRLVASPSSVAFSGDGFDHRFFDFARTDVQTLPRCLPGAARDYGPGEIDAVFNARGDATLQVTEDFVGVRCFGSFQLRTASGAITGSLFETSQSEVFFFEQSVLSGFLVPGTGSVTTRSEGIETIRLINAAE